MAKNKNNKANQNQNQYNAEFAEDINTVNNESATRNTTQNTNK